MVSVSLATSVQTLACKATGGSSCNVPAALPVAGGPCWFQLIGASVAKQLDATRKTPVVLSWQALMTALDEEVAAQDSPVMKMPVITAAATAAAARELTSFPKTFPLSQQVRRPLSQFGAN